MKLNDQRFLFLQTLDIYLLSFINLAYSSSTCIYYYCSIYTNKKGYLNSLLISRFKFKVGSPEKPSPLLGAQNIARHSRMVSEVPGIKRSILSNEF